MMLHHAIRCWHHLSHCRANPFKPEQPHSPSLGASATCMGFYTDHISRRIWKSGVRRLEICWLPKAPRRHHSPACDTCVALKFSGRLTQDSSRLRVTVLWQPGRVWGSELPVGASGVCLAEGWTLSVPLSGLVLVNGNLVYIRLLFLQLLLPPTQSFTSKTKQDTELARVFFVKKIFPSPLTKPLHWIQLSWFLTLFFKSVSGMYSHPSTRPEMHEVSWAVQLDFLFLRVEGLLLVRKE